MSACQPRSTIVATGLVSRRIHLSCRSRVSASSTPRTVLAVVDADFEGSMPLARRRDHVAQLSATDVGRPARQGRARRLLDLHLHQLAAHAALRPRVGREVPRSRPGRDRRAHARVPLRARPRERAPRGAGDARHVSRRGRQRLRDLGRVRQPLLAGALSRRRAGAHSPSSVRRGRLRRVGAGHSTAAGRGGRRAASGDGPGHGRCAVARKSPPIGSIWRRRRPMSATSAPRTSRRPVARSWTSATSIPLPARLRPQSVGAGGEWTVERRVRCAERGQRADRLPLSRARSASGDGTGDARNVRALSRACSMGRRRARRMAATWTSRATAW